MLGFKGYTSATDQQWRASVLALKQLTDDVRLEAGWQYTKNDSNSDLYTYDQHLLTLGIAWAF